MSFLKVTWSVKVPLVKESAIKFDWNTIYLEPLNDHWIAFFFWFPRISYNAHKTIETSLKYHWNIIETSLKYHWNTTETPLKCHWSNTIEMQFICTTESTAISMVGNGFQWFIFRPILFVYGWFYICRICSKHEKFGALNLVRNYIYFVTKLSFNCIIQCNSNLTEYQLPPVRIYLIFYVS